MSSSKCVAVTGHSEVEYQGGVTVLCSEDFGGGAFGSKKVFFIAC